MQGAYEGALAVFAHPCMPVGLQVDASPVQFQHEGMEPFAETWRPSLQRFADNAVPFDDDGGMIADGTQRPLRETRT